MRLARIELGGQAFWALVKRHAAAAGMPIAIVNRGPTRGDALATVKFDNGCSPMLALLADELPGVETSVGMTA